jgi:hypothetical protein
LLANIIIYLLIFVEWIKHSSFVACFALILNSFHVLSFAQVGF